MGTKIDLMTLMVGLGYNFWMICIGFDILHEYLFWQDLSMGTKIFYLTLTLVFELLIENFNLGYILIGRY
jgi:hypothetical protein